VNNTTNGANGLPVISGGARKVPADNLTIVGSGGDVIERSTAAGTLAFRFFDVAAGASLTLQNLTLQGGLAFGSGAAADGGAVYNQGTLNLVAATVQGNVARGTNGAPAGYNHKKQVVPGQTGADAAGGGIWSGGTVKMDGGCFVQNNQALGGRG